MYNTEGKYVVNYMKKGIKMRILICDDDALIIEQLQKYIRNFFENISVKCPELVCFSDGESLLADEGDKVEACLLYLGSTR